MLARWGLLLSLLLVGLLTGSCQKLEPEATSPLKGEKVPFDNAIPREYGKLVSVTGDQELSVLWFVKPDETIVAIGVDVKRRTLSSKALTIPRR